jgi:tight adherence protein B
MSNPTTLIAIGAGVLALVVLLVGVVGVRGQNTAVIEERLGRYAETMAPVTEEERKGAKPSSVTKEERALTKRLDQRLERGKFGTKWKTELARADLKLSVGEFFLAHFGSAIAFGFLLMVIFNAGVVGAIIGGVIGIFVPRFYVSNRKGRRLHQFEGQLPDILGLWVNSLRSGYSTMQSMEAIAREAPEPSAMEFRRVVREVQLGIPQEQALAHLLERMPSEDLDLINTAINIQREVGGNLAEILEVISTTIRERIKLKGEIRVLTAQGRITGYVIGGLPIVLALFLLLINPNYMGRMFSDHLCGWPMLIIGLGMIGAGTAVIQRIVDIKI